MNRTRNFVILTIGSAVLLAIAIGSPQSSAEEDKGKELFLASKCEMCHSVPAAGIEAKVKSAAMQGPDIAGISVDADELGKFLRKQVQIDGKDHKKEYKGSDEDLKTLVSWILSQK